MAWNKPKKNAIREKAPHFIFLTMTPLTIETVKQFIARAMEMSIISQSVILLCAKLHNTDYICNL